MSDSGTALNVEAKARELLRRRDFGGAIALLTAELEQHPDDADLLDLLGMSYFFSRRHEEARATFEKVTRTDPMRRDAWVNLGAVLNRLGDHKHAADALRRALQRDRKCAVAYYNLGIAQKAMNQNTMAISAYKEAIKIKPDMVDAQLNLGKIYLEMNNGGLAQQCFNAALKVDPECAKAKRLLERTHQSQKQARKSASPFGRLVDEETLAKAQVGNTPRSMSAAMRNDERDLCRKLTREMRDAAKEMVPALDQTLHAVLQKLAVGSLQSDNRAVDPAVISLLAETRLLLQKLQEQTRANCDQLREHIQKCEQLEE